MSGHTDAAPAGASADDIVALAEHLCDVLRQENEALTQRRLERVRALQEGKDRLSRAYVRAMTEIAKRPQHLHRAPPRQQVRLRELAARLEELTASNARLLQSAMDSSQRLLDAVIASVKRHQADRGGTVYGRQGELRAGAGATARPALSINGTF